jgi:PE-PPE domain
MKVLARSLVIMFVALIAVPALAVTYTMTTAVQLLATALIMGGTEHPLSPDVDSNAFVIGYMDDAVNNYIDADNGAPLVDNRVAVIYPAQFFPVFGSITFDDSVATGRANLHECLRGTSDCVFNEEIPGSTAPLPTDTFRIYGYSQSAVIASLVKDDLIAGDPPGGPPTAEFFFTSNPRRGNGGILARGFEGMTIPGFGITFSGPARTDSELLDEGDPLDPTDDVYAYPTTDVAQQYDLLGGDAPAVPWNVLSWVNSGFSYALLHGDVPSRTIDGSDPTVIEQEPFGDTRYYMITAPRLPVLMPLEGVVPGPILAVVDAPTRVLVEWGHYRQPSPGEHVPFQLLPETDPITALINLAVSFPVGVDDGLQEAGLGRALGTDDVYRPFGVGGQAYDKDTGEPVEDQTAPLNALNAAPLSTAPAPLNSGPAALSVPASDGTQIESAKQPELGNDALDADTPAEEEGTKPRPLRDVLRLPIQFDRPDGPSVRPNGDGPIRRVINALTGQRPDSTPEPADDKPAEGAEPAA